MTREQTYAAQLKALGIYDPAFEPEIHTLAIMERDLQRALKAWKADDGEMVGKTWDAICSLRRDILAHRDALGLTPKALQRLRSKQAAAAGEQDDISDAFERLLNRVESYESAT